MLRASAERRDWVKQKRAMQGCNPPRDNLVGLIRADVGSAGESSAPALLLSLRQLPRTYRTNSPDALKIPFLGKAGFRQPRKRQITSQPIKSSVAAHEWDTRLSYARMYPIPRIGGQENPLPNRTM
jgi:hypothetical protein